MHDAKSTELPEGLLVSPDLFFTSMISGAATPAGLTITVAPDIARAAEMLARRAYRCLLIDLSTPGLRVGELLGPLSDTSRPYVVAFGPHVHDLRLREAAEAGCDEVLTRGRFSASLPEVLRRCAGA